MMPVLCRRQQGEARGDYDQFVETLNTSDPHRK
jgi:hypothetical protein